MTPIPNNQETWVRHAEVRIKNNQVLYSELNAKLMRNSGAVDEIRK